MSGPDGLRIPGDELVPRSDSQSVSHENDWERLGLPAGNASHPVGELLQSGPPNWFETRSRRVASRFPPVPPWPEAHRFAWLRANPWAPAVLALLSFFLVLVCYPVGFFAAIGTLMEPGSSSPNVTWSILGITALLAVVAEVAATLWLLYFLVRGRWYSLVMLPALVLPILPVLPVILWVMFAEPAHE